MSNVATIAIEPNPKAKFNPPVVLKTWDEAMAYFAQHLKPIAFGPKDQPIYGRNDMDALNVQLPISY